MALTYAKQAYVTGGNENVWVVDVTADSAYPSGGGYTLATADYEALTVPGVTAASQIISFDAETNTAGYTIALDRTNNKIKFILGGVEATTTVSTKTVRTRVGFGYVNYLATP